MKPSLQQTFQRMNNLIKFISSRKIARTNVIFIYSILIVFYGNFIPILRFIKTNFVNYHPFFAIQYSISGIILFISLTSIVLFTFAYINKKLLKCLAILSMIGSGFYSYLVVKMNFYFDENFVNTLNLNNNLLTILDWKMTLILLTFGIFPSFLASVINSAELKKENILNNIGKYIKTLLIITSISFIVCYKSFNLKYFNNIKKQIVPVAIFFPTSDLLKSKQEQPQASNQQYVVNNEQKNKHSNTFNRQ